MADSLLKQFARSSQLGANAAYIEDLYEQYLAAPDSVRARMGVILLRCMVTTGNVRD